MEETTGVERQALELINRARSTYQAKHDFPLPPLIEAPKSDGELHRTLDCLIVRKGEDVLVFDRSVRQMAEACAEAWGRSSYRRTTRRSNSTKARSCS